MNCLLHKVGHIAMSFTCSYKCDSERGSPLVSFFVIWKTFHKYPHIEKTQRMIMMTQAKRGMGTCCSCRSSCRMMTTSIGSIFRVTNLLCGEFIGRTKASEEELWCFLWSAPEKKRLSKQSWGWWFETPLRPLWLHCSRLSDFGLSWNIWESYGAIHFMSQRFCTTGKYSAVVERLMNQTMHYGAEMTFTSHMTSFQVNDLSILILLQNKLNFKVVLTLIPWCD